jgi:hypothetical protein
VGTTDPQQIAADVNVLLANHDQHRRLVIRQWNSWHKLLVEHLSNHPHSITVDTVPPVTFGRLSDGSHYHPHGTYKPITYPQAGGDPTPTPNPTPTPSTQPPNQTPQPLWPG